MSKGDIDSGYVITESVTATAALSAAAHDSDVIDMSLYRSAAFCVDVGDFNTTGTVTGVLQMSHDNSTYVNEDGASGNDTTTGALAAGDEGLTQLNVTTPQRRYYKVVWTVGTTTVTAAAFSVAGPKLTVDPT